MVIKKRGVFFTIDAILAASIIVIAIILASSYYVKETKTETMYYLAHDLIRVFTNLKVNELDNPYVNTLIAGGNITRPDNTILEQIGEFWSENEIEQASNFARNITEALIPQRFGIGIYVNNELIYSRDKPITKALVSSRKLISGIAKERPIDGYTARAILTGINSKTTSAYVYFGGYEGDGNLTKKLILPSDVIAIKNASLELDVGNNFDLYINNKPSGYYVKGSAGGGYMLADKWDISPTYFNNFQSGENLIKIVFAETKNNYIAGGHLKVVYTTSDVNDTTTLGSEKFYLPGIEGFINLYSSIYVPGYLKNIEIYLNFFSNFTTYLKIGNTTLYNNNPNGTEEITLNNSTLSSIFSSNNINYNDLSLKTLPLRMGSLNVTGGEGNADSILVTDVSGSMNECTSGGGIVSSCTTWNWQGLDLTGRRWINSQICEKKINVYKEASKSFTDILLNITGNKIGLVEYTDDYGGCGLSFPPLYWCSNVCKRPPVYNCGLVNSGSNPCYIPFPDSIARTQDLTTDSTLIKNKIDTTETWWLTCICCGVNKAVELLNAQSSTTKNKSLVVMSDGEANVRCAQQGTGNAKQDAILAAQQACSQGIRVYTIGFGADADETTLQQMACGGGSYHSATNPAELEEVYKEIAGEISKVSYVEQIATDVTINSILNYNSYIQIDYTQISTMEFSKIPITTETDRFNNNITQGILTIPENMSVIDAKVTSYSGSKWTDNLVVDSNQVYKLSSYGNEYSILGDPYIVQIPVNYLNEGSNDITISTGISPTNSTGGSKDDKAIYTLLLNGASSFTDVLTYAYGCNWFLEFEDGASTIIKVPAGYTGTAECNYVNASYAKNDAINTAAYELFSQLDPDKDGKLEVNLVSKNINVDSLLISKVPSLWGPAIVEIRVWE